MKLSLLVVAAPLIATVAGQWSVKNGELNIFSSGKKISSNTFDDTRKLSLSSDNSLEVTFETLKGDKGGQAHQTMMALTDPSTGLEFFFPASVRPSGKAKVSVNSNKIPKPLHGKALEVSILVGSFDDNKPVQVHAGSALVVASNEEHRFPVRLGAKPEIIHEFRPSPRTVPPFIAIAFAGGAVFFSLILFLYWGSIGANVHVLPKALSDSPIGHIGLLVSIASFEAVFILYYLGMSIFDTLFLFAIISPIMIYTGSRALRDIRDRRESTK